MYDSSPAASNPHSFNPSGAASPAASKARRHARFVACQQACRRASARLILEIEIPGRLPGRVADDERLGMLIDGPRRRANFALFLIKRSRFARRRQKGRIPLRWSRPQILLEAVREAARPVGGLIPQRRGRSPVVTIELPANKV